MKIVLTIAGTDPSGAAGIQADLQTIRDHGHHGVSAITAVLAQNTQGVRHVQPVAPGLLAAQIDAVFEDFDVAAVKVGLVPNDELIEVIEDAIGDVPIVWDPVLASGDGATPLFTGTVERLVEALQNVMIATPNIPELETVAGLPVRTRDAANVAGRAFTADGPALLIKTGHLDHRDVMCDIWAADGDVEMLLPLPTVDADVRGTGCQLSSAIACQLAGGVDPRQAAERARAYLNDLLHNHARRLGRGRPLIVRDQ